MYKEFTQAGITLEEIYLIQGNKGNEYELAEYKGNFALYEILDNNQLSELPIAYSIFGIIDHCLRQIEIRIRKITVGGRIEESNVYLGELVELRNQFNKMRKKADKYIAEVSRIANKFYESYGMLAIFGGNDNEEVG